MLKLHLSSYKHSEGSSPQFVLKCSPQLAFHVKRFLSLRGSSDGPLFIHKSKKPFSRAFIASCLSSDLSGIGLNPKNFNTHSFRIGRATDLALQGFSTHQISTLGRWRSNAFQKYIKPVSVNL